VFGDACRDEGMGELQEDRARPPEEHKPLGVDSARDGVDYRNLAATWQLCASTAAWKGVTATIKTTLAAQLFTATHFLW
jgi:hypothetical protein